MISPSRGDIKKYLKPPTSYAVPHCGNNAVYLHNLKLLEFSEIPLDEYHHLRVQSLFQSTCDKHPEKTLAITIISFFPRFIPFHSIFSQNKEKTQPGLLPDLGSRDAGNL